ncbi:polyprenol phosphomannose-dependent alpha 1,6 mannosyltransferase MptB [Micromonospora sp. WMMD729]|uniref:polyprenol phosphomannose-dependent alpha 1,6 mannosyltransferase MptB n=1 Tax=Micromonospora sp. WMMD729 TaxID=3404127 RepID=UPI003BF6059F
MTAPGALPPLSRPSVARSAGLLGAVLLAVAGYLGGALPDAPLNVTPVSIWRAPGGPATVTCWLVGTVLLVGAWWSLRAGAPSTRWAYVTATLWALPLLLAPPVGSRDVYSYACQGWTYAHGLDPYAVGVAAAGCPWQDTVAPIWRDTPAPYGPVFVLLAALAVSLGGGLVGALVALRLIAVAGLVVAACCLPGLARAAGLPARRAVWLALAGPLVGVHLVGGAHNDAVMLGLLLCGLLVVLGGPDRPSALLAAGALLGCAVTVKATAVVVVPFAVLAGTSDRTVLRNGVWLGGGLAAAVLGSSALTGLGFGWVGGLTRSGDSEQWTSPPTAVGFVVDYAGMLAGRDPQAVPVARAVALGLLAAVLVALWWRTWRRLRRDQAGTDGPPVAGSARGRMALHGAALALVATVVLSPVFHPWYATWPLALLALAATRTTWFVLPAGLAALLVLPDGTNLARFTKAPGALAMTALLLVLLVRVRSSRPARRPRP